jgi:vacuolar protein sorting-associated protein 54
MLVTEQPSATDSSSGQDIDPASISHSLPLLEKLSHYADTVEQHLVREVQARSSSFFEALGNLHDLQSESERCLRRIGELKGMLKDVDEKQAKRGLEIVRSEFQIEEMVKVEEGVKVMKEVNDMKGIALGLVAAGEWRDALNVIENIQHLWDHASTETLAVRSPPTIPSTGLVAVAESPLPSPAQTLSETLPPISLASLHAFSSLPQDLRALTMQISSFLSSELVAVLRIDMGSRIEMGDTRVAEDDLTFRDQIRPLLLGLLRTNGVRDVIVGWRDVAMADVRASVKRVSHSLPITRLYG